MHEQCKAPALRGAAIRDHTSRRSGRPSGRLGTRVGDVERLRSKPTKGARLLLLPGQFQTFHKLSSLSEIDPMRTLRTR